MPNGHPKAILLANRNRPHHRFNEQVIGDGQEHDVEFPNDPRCMVRLNVGVPWQNIGEQHLFLRQTRIGCHVNTDSIESLFQGDVAAELHLRLPNLRPDLVDPAWFQGEIADEDDPNCVVMGAVSTFVGRFFSGYWCEREIHVGLYPGFVPVKVWFPIELGNNGWQWRLGFPIWNVLGMRGVIDKRMLSVNDLELYSMEWRSPESDLPEHR